MHDSNFELQRTENNIEVVNNFVNRKIELGSNRDDKWCNFVIVNQKQTAMETLVSLEEQIAELNAQLTGDMFTDMDIKDKIHNLDMQLKGVKPTDSHFDCVGCGS